MGQNKLSICRLTFAYHIKVKKNWRTIWVFNLGYTKMMFSMSVPATFWNKEKSVSLSKISLFQIHLILGL